RDHSDYEQKFIAGTKEDFADLAERGVKPSINSLWSLPCNPVDLPKPDILPTIQLGMLTYLMDWVMELLQLHKQVGIFNTIWIGISRYPGLVAPSKAY